MKATQFWIVTVVVALTATVGALHAQTPMGTAFTYQGQLNQGGLPVTGTADIKFSLWDDLSTPPGIQVGSTLVFDGQPGNPGPVNVVNGLFTVVLDFGMGVFTGDARWLEIEVRVPHDPGNTLPYTVLSPRQELTPTPYTIYAETAGSATNAITGSGTAGRIAKFVDSSSIGDSVIRESAGVVSIGSGGWPGQEVELEVNGDITFTWGADRTFCPGYVSWGAASGNDLTIHSGNGGGPGPTPAQTPFPGGDLYLKGGNAAGLDCSAAGGDVYIHGGSRIGSASEGDVILAHTGSAARGKVGIGEISPTAKLHIGGTPGVDGIKFPDGTLQTTAATGGGGGDITAVIAGAGLSGGGYSGDVTLDIEVPLSLMGSSSGGIIEATNTGSGYQGDGGYFRADALQGRGVVGYAPAGGGCGIWGEATGGTGVHGEATVGTGVHGVAWDEGSNEQNHGGYFGAGGGRGVGVHGGAWNSNGSTNYGGHFEAAGSSGRGVAGFANHPSGTNYGVYGWTWSQSGYGGYFVAERWLGPNHGVYGESASSIGYGGHFVASASSGVNYGVYGATNSSAGYAGYFHGDVYVTGNLGCGGNKPFIQPHPKDASKEIVYIAAEAPEAIVLLRGTGRLKEGVAVIEPPKYFQLVAAQKGVQVQVTPHSADTFGLAAVERSREKIVVKELKNGRGNFGFDYVVTAVRAGFEGHQPVMANTHYKPRTDETAEEFEARFSEDDMSTKAIRSMLISNGILTEDGKLSKAKIEALGWTVAEKDKAAEDHVHFMHPEAYGVPDQKRIETARNAEVCETREVATKPGDL